MCLSACASSDVSGIKVAGQDEIQSVKISEVDVTLETPKPNLGLQSALRDELKKAMAQCATGDQAHRMKVTVTDFEDQDVAKAIFIGDEIELEGRVELIDLATGTQTAEYYVENSFFWGGLVGAAMMSDAEKNLSEDFAKTICEELFGTDLESASYDPSPRENTLDTNSGSQPTISPTGDGEPAAAGATSSASIPPVKSREEVEFYLRAHDEDIRRALFEYARDHGLISSGAPYREFRVFSSKVVETGGDQVVVRIAYSSRTKFNPNWYDRHFRARWIGEDLVFTGHV